MKFVYAVLLLLFIAPLFAQDQEDFQEIASRYGYPVTRIPTVNFNYFIDYDTASGTEQFMMAVAIQNDFLQFTRQENHFYANYQITMHIRKDEQSILARTWEAETHLADFEKTNSRRDYQYQDYKVDLRQAGVTFDAGSYEIFLEINDKLSSKEYKNKRIMKIDTPGTQKVFKQSGIAFFEKNEDETLHLAATRDNLAFNKPYTAYACLKSDSGKISSVNARLFKKDKEQNTLLAQTFIEPEKNKNGVFCLKYELPYLTMEEGKYLARFTIETDQNTFELERTFSVLWFTKPLYLYKVDLAVRPMKYILSEEQVEKVKEMSIPELKKWFKAWWKEKDPTPETAYNELMEEYFTRVSEAVRNYSTRFKEGWQTDRGMVFLLYGAPKEVENRKYAANSVPHIIWKYENEIFTFADLDKTGEFKLLRETD